MANERYIHKIGDMVHDGFTTTGTIVDIQKDSRGRLEYHVSWHCADNQYDVTYSHKYMASFKMYLEVLTK